MQALLLIHQATGIAGRVTTQPQPHWLIPRSLMPSERLNLMGHKQSEDASR